MYILSLYFEIYIYIIFGYLFLTALLLYIYLNYIYIFIKNVNNINTILWGIKITKRRRK